LKWNLLSREEWQGEMKEGNLTGLFGAIDNYNTCMGHEGSAICGDLSGFGLK